MRAALGGALCAHGLIHAWLYGRAMLAILHSGKTAKRRMRFTAATLMVDESELHEQYQAHMSPAEYRSGLKCAYFDIESCGTAGMRHSALRLSCCCLWNLQPLPGSHCGVSISRCLWCG